MDRGEPRHWWPRSYTPAEECVIAHAARRLEDEAVARLYLDLARWERGRRP